MVKRQCCLAILNRFLPQRGKYAGGNTEMYQIYSMAHKQKVEKVEQVFYNQSSDLKL